MNPFSSHNSGSNLEKHTNGWLFQSQRRYHFFLFGLTLAIIYGMVHFSISFIENRTLSKFENLASDFSLEWLTVKPNGTKLVFSGTPPNQLEYLGLISLVNLNFDPDGIINNIQALESSYTPSQNLELIMYSKDSTIFIFGSFSNSEQKTSTLELLSAAHPEKNINDFSTLKSDVATTELNIVVEYGTRVLNSLLEGMVTISDNTVSVTSHINTQEATEKITAQFMNDQPDEVDLELNLSYPIPLIKPYRFGIFLNDQDSRLEICHVADATSQDKLISLLNPIIPDQEPDCQIAHGAPSPAWLDLISQLLETLANSKETHLRISDFSVIVMSRNELSDLVIDSLEEIFNSSHGEEYNLRILSNTDESTQLSPDFLRITKDLENNLTVFGAIPDNSIKSLLLDIMTAYFLKDEISDFIQIEEASASLDLELITTGIKSLTLLDEGELVVPENELIFSGKVSSSEKYNSFINYLSSELNQGNFVSNVEIDEDLIPPPPLSAEECRNGIAEVLVDKKISFDSGSVEINEQTGTILPGLAEVLIKCNHFTWEIGGHTDSQGRESMNFELSSKRASAILDALVEAGVPSDILTAIGYGERFPIANNRTEAGREKNRRIVIQILENGIE